MEKCVLCGWVNVERDPLGLDNHLRFNHFPKEWYPMVSAAIALGHSNGQGFYSHNPENEAIARGKHLADEWEIDASTHPEGQKLRILKKVNDLRKALKIGSKA